MAIILQITLIVWQTVIIIVCHKGDQMLVLLGKLSTLLDLSERIAGRGETAGKLRKRQRAKYFVDGMQLCRNTLKCVHAYVFCIQLSIIASNNDL